MKRVLIVMSSLYNGGAERSLVNLLNELPKNKYQVDILLFNRGGLFLKQVPSQYCVLETPKELERLYGQYNKAGSLLPIRVLADGVSKIMTKNSRERRAFRWKYFYSHIIKCLNEEYDVALGYISGEILYFLDEKVNAKKKIVWIHNDYRSAQHPRKYDYPHLAKMDAIVSISDLCVNILKEEFPEFAEKTFMIENITSSVVINNRANDFYPTEYEGCTNTILSIGRLSEQKGFDLAVEAASIMKSKGLSFKWFIIGTGELEDELKKSINKYDLEDYFILLGARENPYPYIKNATIFVQPSRFEGKSVVLDEAKILKASIVATSYPTVYDQMEDGKEGLIVPISPEGISYGVIKLINNIELRKDLKEYLSKRDYGNQSEVDKYMSLID